MYQLFLCISTFGSDVVSRLVLVLVAFSVAYVHGFSSFAGSGELPG